MFSRGRIVVEQQPRSLPAKVSYSARVYTTPRKRVTVITTASEKKLAPNEKPAPDEILAPNGKFVFTQPPIIGITAETAATFRAALFHLLRDLPVLRELPDFLNREEGVEEDVSQALSLMDFARKFDPQLEYIATCENGSSGLIETNATFRAFFSHLLNNSPIQVTSPLSPLKLACIASGQDRVSGLTETMRKWFGAPCTLDENYQLRFILASQMQEEIYREMGFALVWAQILPRYEKVDVSRLYQHVVSKAQAFDRLDELDFAR